MPSNYRLVTGEMAKSRIKKNARVRRRKKVEKRRKEKAGMILKGVGKLSLSFLIVAGVVLAARKAENFLTTSPHFRISEVSFEGLSSLERKTLESLAKIRLGKNIFRVDMEGIRKRLQSHPQIREVVISRQFPRRVKVKVKEREAVALIRNDGKIYPLDGEGFVMPEVFPSRSLPLITGLGRGGMKVGEKIEETKLVVALDILEAFSSSGLFTSTIDMEGRSPVVWIGEVKIFLGEEGGEEEAKELRFILKDIERRKEKAEYLDLRFHDPVVKLR